jgi:hypothetical protein
MILANLMVGFAAMLVCLIVQAAVAFWSVRYCVRQSSNTAAPRKFIAGIRPLLIAMLAMIAGNVIQITLWGVLFLLLGELDELYEAIYHSAVNFASLGYGGLRRVCTDCFVDGTPLLPHAAFGRRRQAICMTRALRSATGELRGAAHA